MDARELARLEVASRATMAYEPDDVPHNTGRLVAAALPALGILAACALLLTAVL